MDFKYRNVTITGKVGVGKSTLRRSLEQRLAPYGWRSFSVGDLQRQYQTQRGLSVLEGATNRPDDREKEIEALTKKRLKEEDKWIYEAWLAGYMAQGIPGVLKVLIICSHNEVRVDRVVNRDSLNVTDAKYWIKRREEENLEKWQELYGKVDFWDPKMFDLVIDTYSTSKEQTVLTVLDRLGYPQPRYKKITISGKICTGKTTLFWELVKALGWPTFSASQFFRDYARKNTMSLEKADEQNDQLTREVDTKMQSLLKQGGNLVLEGWMAGIMADDFPNVLRILLKTDDDERVKRFSRRDQVPVSEAQTKVLEREKNWMKKLEKIYNRNDFFDEKNYNLIIDTTNKKPEEILSTVLQKVRQTEITVNS